MVEKIFDTGFEWQEGTTLHIQGRLLCNHDYSENFSACYIVVRLRLVKVVKLTTYLICPWHVYPAGYLSCKQIFRISESQFRVFQEIARGVTLLLERCDLLFLWLQTVGVDHDSLFALRYNLEAPAANTPFVIHL